MSDVDISKLKVTELREELKKHGLETKGKKEQLVKRLENFLSGSAGKENRRKDRNKIYAIRTFLKCYIYYSFVLIALV